MNWKTFREGHPQLGMAVELRAGDKILEAGTVQSLVALGEGTISITTEKYVNMVVRLGYEWREVEHQSPST